jgi:hypothetical protein
VGFALCRCFQISVGNTLDVAGKQSRFLAVLHQFLQRAARPYDLGRQIVHADVAAIGENNAALRVEHAQALRHVVERVRQPAILRCQAAVPNADQCQRGNAQRREQQRLAGNGRWQNGRKHAGPGAVLRADIGCGYWMGAIAIWLTLVSQQFPTKSPATCTLLQLTAAGWDSRAVRG